MLQKHKTYSKPKRPFEKERILDENRIRKKFGLKNKREIWKAEAKIKIMREKAKKLIGSDQESQQRLFDQLQRIGLKVESIPDVLGLTKEDLLKRRLQSVLVDKQLAYTQKHARQLITHKKVSVQGGIVDSPSYIVPIALEGSIAVKKPTLKEEAVAEVAPEVAESVPEEETPVEEVAEGESDSPEEEKHE